MRRRLLLFALSSAALRAGAQAPDAATLTSMRWRSVGPVNMAGRITDVEGDPRNPKVFFVAGATGGLWKTINAGTTFMPLWDDQPIASIGDVAIAPSDPQVVWVGTGEDDSRNSVAPGYGIFKSTDGGVTWQSMGLEKTQHIGRIVVHPRDPNIVYVSALGALWGTNPERGLYKTTDGGKTWQLIKQISDRAGFIDIAMDPRNPDVIFAASYERIRKPHYLKSGGPGSALWKSVDAGKTWTEVKGGGFPETPKGRIGLAIAPSNGDIVYALVEADSVRGAKPQRLLSGLYRSADGGRTWKWMSTRNNRPFYFSQIRVDPRDPNRIYRMAVDFQWSEDGGYSWRTGMVGIHEDYHAMWIDPNDPEHYIVGGDAGIFQTWDKGGTFDALNNMAMGQFYGISYDFQAPYRVCGGLQDNGTSCGVTRRLNGQLQMTDWFSVFAADGLQTAQDPRDPNVIYYESQGGNLARRNLATGETVNLRPRTINANGVVGQIARIRGDGSKPLTPEQQKQIADLRAQLKRDLADPNAAARWNWNTPFILSKHNPSVFYTGADKLFRSVEGGLNAVAISPDLSSKDADRLRISTGVDAEGNSALDASGGITRDATGAEENGTIVTISESPFRPGVLYVGTNDGKVWLTRNDGGSWEDLSARFPGVPPMTYVSRVEASSHDSATVFVSFDNHRENDFTPYLFISTDFGKTFRSIANTIPRDGRPSSVYVVRQDPVNRSLLYIGTELGVYGSLDVGTSWFKLSANMPVVPVYDLQVHPRDRELIAGTHGRGIHILDVAPLQQMNGESMQRSVQLFEPAIALQYGQMLPGSEPRAQRMWRADGGPSGAVISYRLGAASAAAPRVLIVNAAGDTIARLTGGATPGLQRVTWNMMGTGFAQFGFSGQFPQLITSTTNTPGFPAGFLPRPAESRAAADTTSSPTAPQVAGGPGPFGGGGPGGGARPATRVDPGDYRVVLDVDGQKQTTVLRIARVAPGALVVMEGVPARR